jgi:acetone carboxylase gamma subunit
VSKINLEVIKADIRRGRLTFENMHGLINEVEKVQQLQKEKQCLNNLIAFLSVRVIELGQELQTQKESISKVKSKTRFQSYMNIANENLELEKKLQEAKTKALLQEIHINSLSNCTEILEKQVRDTAEQLNLVRFLVESPVSPELLLSELQHLFEAKV